MPLIYSFVSRGAEGSHVILAEYTPFSGNFNTVALEILQKISNPDSKFTIACDKHTFNFLVNNGFTYLVVADEEYGRQIPFAFLERVNGEFEEKMTEKGATASAHALDRTFGPRLKSHMEYCMAHPDEISKIASVQKKVNDVKDVMMENIEKVLERGEKIELMVDKADELQTQANQFQKKGRQLRNKMWWQNCRMKLYVLAALLVLGVIIFLIVCFAGSSNCIKGENNQFADAGVIDRSPPEPPASPVSNPSPDPTSPAP